MKASLHNNRMENREDFNLSAPRYPLSAIFTGSTIAMTDQNQNIINKYAYTAFGEINEEETIPQPFKYVGQYGVQSDGNNLYYMRARYYDARLGRFLQQDPLGLGGGDINLYVYVGNNPVMRFDPFGNAWMEIRPLDADGLRNTTWGPFYHVRFRYDNGNDFGYGYRQEATVGIDTTDMNNRYQRVGVYLDDATLDQARMNIDNQWNQLANPSAPDYFFPFMDCKAYARAVINEYNSLAQENGVSGGIYTKKPKP